MSNVKLEERKKNLEKEFNELNEVVLEKVESIKKLQQEINELRTKQQQLSGAFSEINLLLREDENEKVAKKEKPNKK